MIRVLALAFSATLFALLLAQEASARHGYGVYAGAVRAASVGTFHVALRASGYRGYRAAVWGSRRYWRGGRSYRYAGRPYLRYGAESQRTLPRAPTAGPAQREWSAHRHRPIVLRECAVPISTGKVAVVSTPGRSSSQKIPWRHEPCGLRRVVKKRCAAIRLATLGKRLGRLPGQEGFASGDPDAAHATRLGESEAVNVETRGGFKPRESGTAPSRSKLEPSEDQFDWSGVAKAQRRPPSIMKLGGPSSKPAREPSPEKVLFGGENAVIADRGKLAHAKEMAAGREKREAIWRTTGWWQGGDKIWRFEIPDDEAALSNESAALYAQVIADPKATRETTVGALLEHPLLKKAYPHLLGIKVLIVSPMSKALQEDSGGWEPETRTITVGRLPISKSGCPCSCMSCSMQCRMTPRIGPRRPSARPTRRSRRRRRPSTSSAGCR